MQKYLVLVMVLLVLPVMAFAADPYVVTGVQADVTAATAAKARDQAIHEASRKAFETLSAQMFPNKPVPKVSDQAIGNMVSDFHVEQEQTTASRYAATFTFRFRQNPVRAAFGTRAVLSPHDLAERLKNPDAAPTQSDVSLDEIIADESKPPSQQQGLIADVAADLPAPGNAILVEVTAHNSRELDQAMDRFRNITAVREVEYVSITPDKSILRLSYAGEAQKMLGQMQSSGVSLRPDADGATQPPLYVLEP